MESAGLEKVNSKLGGKSDGEGVWEQLEGERMEDCGFDQNTLYACRKLSMFSNSLLMKLPPVTVATYMSH